MTSWWTPSSGPTRNIPAGRARRKFIGTSSTTGHSSSPTTAKSSNILQVAAVIITRWTGNPTTDQIHITT